MEGYHHSEVYRLNVLTQRGQWLKLVGSPQIGPDTNQFIVASGALDGMGTPAIQLFQRRKDTWREVWKVESHSWQVEQVEWVAANELLLQQKHWNQAFSQAWYSYAKITIQDR